MEVSDHYCKAYASEDGICSICGNVVPGSLLFFYLKRCDPSEIDRDHITERPEI